MIRKVFFWLHLTAGVVAGLVIFIMSVTGVLIAFQRQIIHWADRDFRRPQHPGVQSRMAPETLLRQASEHKGSSPTALTLRADTEEPAAAEYGREGVLYLNPWTGEVLGEGSATVRQFFRETENWHRWLAAGLQSRATARGITGASNLVFLGILFSGLYLWLPKAWSRQHLRPAIWFRRGVRGKARDWNWHNTIGLWCFLPLVVIVASGVVMSYPWANVLVYKVAGSEVPQGGNGGPPRGGAPASDVSFDGLDPLWERARHQIEGWTAITMRVPASERAPVQFVLDRGDGGQPQLRDTLTLNRTTGGVVRWEPFSSSNSGRRLRSYLRFAHTGEVAGTFGQIVAATASAGGAVLVWTGISLAIRRLLAAQARRRKAVPEKVWA